MLGSLLRRLTGQRSEPTRPQAPLPPPAEEVRVDATPPADAAGEPELLASGLEAPVPPGGPGRSPVFSSRAVRDATVVTGTIESLTRFVAGQDMLDDLTWRLESLTPDQVNFLQLSAEPGLIQRAQARSEALKGAKAAALRKLLTDLAGGAIPEPLNRSNPLSVPKGPILPPLASLQPRPAGVASETPPLAPAPAPVPSLTAAPPLPTRPIPPPPRPAPPPAAKPLGEPPPTPAQVPDIAVTLPPLSAPEPVIKPPASTRSEVPEPVARPIAAPAPKPATTRPPEPQPAKAAEPAPKGATAATTEPVAPRAEPAPAPKPPEPAKAPEPPRPAPAVPEPAAAIPAMPRLGRQDAEARRARLLASLNDTLSSSEAAP